MKYLGVDIGGTKTAVGLINEENKLVEKRSLATDVKGGVAEIAKNAARLIDEIFENQGLTYSDIEYVGVGVPGSVDNDKGLVLYANNLDFLNAPLRDEMAKYIPLPIYLENDANCAALGEYFAFKEKEDVDDFFMVTLGTGVGSGSIINGKLFKGFNNAAPEGGHMNLVPGGRLCTCGNKGCWEMYSSGTGLTMTAREIAEENLDSLMWELAGGKIENIDGRTPFEAASKGDKAAKEVLDKFFYHLGVALVSVVNLFQPEIITIGGGVSEQGDILIDKAQEAINNGSYTKTSRVTRVVKAELGNEAGIYGAAFLRR